MSEKRYLVNRVPGSTNGRWQELPSDARVLTREQLERFIRDYTYSAGFPGPDEVDWRAMLDEMFGKKENA